MNIRNTIRSAVVFLALFLAASCDMSEIVDSAGLSASSLRQQESSASNVPITFTATLQSETKAMDVTSANLSWFTVEAMNHNTSSSYLADTFLAEGSPKVFRSTSPFYWPESGSLDFYAFTTGSAVGQVVRNSASSFTVTPSSDPAAQADLLFACSKGKGKGASSQGSIPLVFRQAGSRVCVNVKNTSSDYRFIVTGWKVGYVATTGTFTYSGGGTESGALSSSMWSGNTTRSADRSYASTFSAVNVAASTTTPVSLSGDMMLVPQSGAAATAYASSSTGAALNGSYVAIRMAVRKVSDDSVVQAETWAVWPSAISWEPGKAYTYTVDLAGGGYFETNQEGTDAELDPIISQEVLAPGFIIPTAANITVGEPEVITIVTSMNMEAGTVWGVRLVGPGGSTTHTGTLGIPGTGSMTINGLSAGSYTVYPYITVDGVTYGYEYGSDPAYFQTNTFTVKNATALSVLCSDITVGGTEDITVYAPMAATGNITLSVNGNSYTQAITEGCAEFSVSGLPVGSYTAVATYAGDASYSSATASNTFTVSLPEHVMTVSVDDIYVGSNAVVTLTTNVAGTYTLQIDGGTVYSETVTDELLEATWNISGLTAGEKTAVVRFAGNGDYPEKGVAKTFTVSKHVSSFRLSLKDYAFNKTGVITCTVSGDATGICYATVDDIVFSGQVINGKAKIVLSGLIPGNYTAQVWYEGDDYYSPSSIISTSFTVAFYSGKFSVSASDKVSFSRGNLRASTTDYGATWRWSFATRQWETIGGVDQSGSGTPTGNNYINGNGTLSANGTVDLFGWSTSATHLGIYNSTNNADYSGDFIDWGSSSEVTSTIGTSWRTLTQQEWYYLLVTRTTSSGSRFVKAVVNGVYGLILFPDDWNNSYHSITASYINNNAIAFNNVVISFDTWFSDFEYYGAIFLPVAGQRHVNNGYVEYPNGRGHYWSSTPYDSGTAYRVYFTGSSSQWSYGVSSSRRFGYSVRLVKDQ